jgi:hypothetical protein
MIDIPSSPGVSVDLGFGSLNPPTPGPETVHLNLWDQAYQRLSVENKDLVEAYEAILARSADVDQDLPLNEKATVSAHCIPWAIFSCGARKDTRLP